MSNDVVPCLLKLAGKERIRNESTEAVTNDPFFLPEITLLLGIQLSDDNQGSVNTGFTPFPYPPDM